MKSTSALLSFILTLAPLTVHATIVTTSADEDDGSLSGGAGISLREAVKYSSADATITFAPELSGQTIRLTGGYLPINQSVTIDASALPEGLTLSADRTGDGKTPDDTYAILLTGGNVHLDSLTLSDANCGESSGCITIERSSTFTLTLDHCTITRNAGYHASALYFIGSSAQSSNAITIRNSTVSRNTVVKGSSVFSVAHCNLTIQSSTFSQNEAGAIGYRSSSALATLSIQNSTISKNAGTYRSGGLNLEITSSPPTAYINNTICAGNEPDNIYNPSPAATISGTNNILSGDPLLAPLGDYGGRTETMPPLTEPRSPAIDSASYPPNRLFDQRGFPITEIPDIGAVEHQGTADLARFWELDFDGDGSPYGIEIALGTDPFAPDATNPRNLTPPIFNSSGHVTLSFGTRPLPGIRWILMRSPDLSPGSFIEVYSTDLITDTATNDVSFVRSDSSITITDEKPLPVRGFYRFEAQLAD